jgi:ABC-type sugar transport system ATPase subunit
MRPIPQHRLILKFKAALQTLGIPVVYVTHDKLEAELLGDRFLAMVNGKITDVPSATGASRSSRTISWPEE